MERREDEVGRETVVEMWSAHAGWTTRSLVERCVKTTAPPPVDWTFRGVVDRCSRARARWRLAGSSMPLWHKPLLITTPSPLPARLQRRQRAAHTDWPDRTWWSVA